MNICFLNFPEHSGAAMSGGRQRASSLLAKELRRRGHNVEFFFAPSRRFRLPFGSAFLSSIFNRSAGIRFREFLKAHKMDVAVWHEGGEWVSPFPVKNLPCKLITFCHGSPSLNEQVYASAIIKRLRLRSRFTKGLVRSKPCSFLLWKLFEWCRSRAFYRFCRLSDKFNLLSKEFFIDFDLAKKFPEKVCAIPNIAPFGQQDVDFSLKKKELLWVGRVNFPQKRPDLMLQIWQRLQDRFPDWKLRIVGDGDYLPELKKLSSSLGLKNVFFEGFQDPAPYYRSASIYCMTSAFEGFPMVLLEAANYGCAPVAFDSFGSVRDIIEDGVSGVLVPAFDLDKYAERLSELMLAPDLRSCLALNAQKSVSRFSPEKIGDKWEKLLQNLG